MKAEFALLRYWFKIDHPSFEPSFKGTDEMQ